MSELDSNHLSRAVDGDREALAQLLEHHGPAVRKRFAGRIPRRWRSALSVDDVMQQTYIDAFVDFPRFVPNGRGSFSAWLASLAKCNLLDALRMLNADKRGRNGRRIASRSSQDTLTMLYEEVGASHSTPSRRAARIEANAALGSAVEQLPETYRRVVQMYDLDGCPVDSVASELGRSPGAVYMLRARAHRRLREIMGNASRYLTTT